MRPPLLERAALLIGEVVHLIHAGNSAAGADMPENSLHDLQRHAEPLHAGRRGAPEIVDHPAPVYSRRGVEPALGARPAVNRPRTVRAKGKGADARYAIHQSQCRRRQWDDTRLSVLGALGRQVDGVAGELGPLELPNLLATGAGQDQKPDRAAEGTVVGGVPYLRELDV